MARKGRGGGGHGGGGHEGPDERWLLTYADMITLLLALFILLFAMSSIDATKFNALAESVSDTFHGPIIKGQPDVLTGSKSALSPSETAQHTTQQALRLESQTAQRKAMKQLESKLDERLGKSKLAGKAEALTTEKGVVIRLAGDALFASGSAEMNNRMQPAMSELAKVLRGEERRMSVEGHTDGVPISTASFPSNWELSGARALTIMRYLMSEGVSGRKLHFTGYADQLPLVQPHHPRQAIARNRRVEIVILNAGPETAVQRAQETKRSMQRGTRPAGSIAPADELVGPIIDLSQVAP